MPQPTSDNAEIDSVGFYTLLVTKVINEQGEIQYVASQEGGVELPVEEIPSASDSQNFVLNCLPDCYSELPQGDSIILHAGENVESSLENQVDAKSANIIGGTMPVHNNTHLVRPHSFKCIHCESSFPSKKNLNQHLRIHLDIKEFSCPVCSKKFSTNQSLKVHSIVHTGLKPHACNICTKAFDRKIELQDHERTHTGERPYKCETCGAAFSQRSNLQSHKRTTHLNDKRYKCETCGIGYKRKRLLDYHIKAAHTGERPFKCEECEATFVYPEHFKKHKLIHTGVKPYSCSICDKNFNTRDNRNEHRYIHFEEKPYECVVCKSGFMRKPQLFEHMAEKNHWSDAIAINQLRLSNNEHSNDGIPEYTIVTTLQMISITKEDFIPEESSLRNISEGNEVLTDDDKH